MPFDLEKLFVDVFDPQPGEIVTVLYDLPHDAVADGDAWKQRREMAERWHKTIKEFASTYNITVNPIMTFPATGSHNADLPEFGDMNEKKHKLMDCIKQSTIVIAMTQFSASAPLYPVAKKHADLRIASMPGVMREMEETALTADYSKIADTCARLAPSFEKAVGIEVMFSTGHTCYFDLSDNNKVFQDNGYMHRGPVPEENCFANLPAGEVCACPNEAADSKTTGEIPAVIDNESVVFIIKANKIIDVAGDGPAAERLREIFSAEPALQNIAEVAIGCNDKAVVTGNVLEDEKAGFHWAYGRSDHLGGAIGVDSFSAPERVAHQDIVYASESPIVCSRFDFIFADGKKRTAIVDGEITL